MSDTPSPTSSTDKTVVVDSRQLSRLWTFTYISIGLNVLILGAMLIGCIVRHDHRPDRHGDFGRHGGGNGGRYAMHPGDGGDRFHHFGGPGMQQGWGQRGDFGGQGPMDMERGPGMMSGGPGMMGGGPGMMGGGPGMMSGGPGMMGGGPGMMGGGPGMGRGGPGMGRGDFGGHGMMGGPSVGPFDPAKMTDSLLTRLSTQLTLTDDQKAKMKPIIQDQVTQMQKDMEARRVAMEKAMDETKAKLKTILNADQQKQLDAIPFPGQKPAGGVPPAPAAAK